MANTGKLQKLISIMNEYWPYIIKDEMQAREVRRRLEKSLKEHAAYGEEQRKTIEASNKAAEREAYVNAILDYFKKRNVPELSAPSFLRDIGLPLEGVTLPPDSGRTIQEAIDAAVRMEKSRMGGIPLSEEDARLVSKFQGPGVGTEYSQDIIKQREAAAERGIRGREVGVQEALVPIRKGELAVRLKEIAGQVGDMTAKEARDTLLKLGTERRRYQGMLETKQNEIGGLLGEEELNLIKSNITEIKQLEDKINTKFSKEMGAEYKAIAEDLKAKGYTAADLDTDEKIRGLLTERGYNIQELKKYMR